MSNPSITFRLSEEDKERVRELAWKAGKSLGQVLRECLGVAEGSYAEAFNRGRREGIEVGRKQGAEETAYSLRFPCGKCGREVDVDFTSSTALGKAYWEIVAYEEHRWLLQHAECP